MRYVVLFLLAVGAATLFCQSALAGEKNAKSVLVELDGTASVDPDGDPLRYEWRQVAGPKVVLSDPTAAKPFFRAFEAGLYVFELRVSDGKMWSQPVRVEARVEAENLPPEAIVLPEVTYEVGQTVLIDGSRSRDPEGAKLRYRWSQCSGAPLYLSQEACQQAALAFPAVQSGVYELELVVSDGQNASQPAICRLTIKPANAPPVARAASAQRVILPRGVDEKAQATRRPVAYIEEVGCPVPGETVVLDGRSSYSPSRQPLKYYWKQKSGPFVRSFARPEEGVLTFVAAEEGEYEFELIVSDGGQDSAPTVCRFRVSREGDTPVAVVAGPQCAMVGEEVALDGSRSFDRGASALEYLWRQVEGPRILHYTMPKSDAADIISFVPQEAGRYVFELVVANGHGKSHPARIAIDVAEAKPSLRASINASAQGKVGKPLCLEGEAEGGEGDIVYTWRQVAGPRLLPRPAVQRSLLVVPQDEGIYGFELMAADAKKQVATARVEIAVVADAGDEDAPAACAAEVMTSREDKADGDAPPPADDGQRATPAAYRQRIRHIFQRPIVLPRSAKASTPTEPDISTAAPPELPATYQPASLR